MKLLKTLLIFCLLSLTSAAEARPQLRFHGGKLRIVQFTDLHWDDRSANCPATTATIRAIVSRERPDVAIVTGDVVTAKPGMDGWRHLVRIFEELRLPFIMEMGNHDAEFANKDSVYALLTASPWYAGERGPVEISGVGNCVVPVYGSRTTAVENTRGDGYLPQASQTARQAPAALLYCIDSNYYQPVKEYGEYDWIHFDQIDWYRRMSSYYASLNAGKPLPALAFFHIPLVEMKVLQASDEVLGEKLETEVCSADINSGLFAAFLEKQDVMGIFNGHDHNNDYMGMVRGLGMGYGRVTGADAGSDLKRGARIIDLYEGERRFDTWVVTPEGREDSFYYPSGITSHEERTMTYLPALKVKPTEQGVSYDYYEGPFKKLADLRKAKPLSHGTLPRLSLDPARTEDHFGFLFRAYVRIPKRGVYRFYTYSDDGSQLLVDDHLVVDNDRGHSARRRDGKVALEAGWHQLAIPYFENYMGQTLTIGYSSKDIPETSNLQLWAR